MTPRTSAARLADQHCWAWYELGIVLRRASDRADRGLRALRQGTPADRNFRDAGRFANRALDLLDQLGDRT